MKSKKSLIDDVNRALKSLYEIRSELDKSDHGSMSRAEIDGRIKRTDKFMGSYIFKKDADHENRDLIGLQGALCRCARGCGCFVVLSSEHACRLAADLYKYSCRDLRDKRQWESEDRQARKESRERWENLHDHQ